MSPEHELLRFFSYMHLPEHLQPISKSFHDLANEMDFKLPNGSQKDLCLQRLLEAKDCAVRAGLRPTGAG